jgi:hypothetical protein
MTMRTKMTTGHVAAAATKRTTRKTIGRANAANAANAPCGAALIRTVRTASRIGFTWWGGVLGPWMLTHVRCNKCGTCYNGHTGKSNDTAIVIYVVVGAAIGTVLGACGVLAALLGYY